MEQNRNIQSLKVKGESMVAPGGIAQVNSFPEGVVLYIDHSLCDQVSFGDYVIAEAGAGKSVLFRRLEEAEGARVLAALNPDKERFPNITEGYRILAKVFQASRPLP